MTFYALYRPHRMMRRWMQMATASMDEPEWSLAVNLRENEDAFILQALVPSLRAEDLNVQVLEDTVTLTGEFKREEGNYLLYELPRGQFRRDLRLPAPVEAEKVEARLENGLLTLRLPKAQSARPKVIKVAAR